MNTNYNELKIKLKEKSYKRYFDFIKTIVDKHMERFKKICNKNHLKDDITLLNESNNTNSFINNSDSNYLNDTDKQTDKLVNTSGILENKDCKENNENNTSILSKESEEDDNDINQINLNQDGIRTNKIIIKSINKKNKKIKKIIYDIENQISLFNKNYKNIYKSYDNMTADCEQNVEELSTNIKEMQDKIVNYIENEEIEVDIKSKLYRHTRAYSSYASVNANRRRKAITQLDENISEISDSDGDNESLNLIGGGIND